MQIVVIDLKGLWITSNLHLPFSTTEKKHLQSELKQVLAARPSVVVIIGLNQKIIFSTMYRASFMHSLVYQHIYCELSSMVN